MNLQNKITYDEISPITKNLTVLIDKDEETGIISKLCMESGFTTNTLMIDTEEFWESLKYHFPIGHQFAYKDDTGTIWIPSAQASPSAAIYPAEDRESQELIWQVTPAIFDDSLPEGELELDFDASKRFGKFQYSDAFDLFAKWSNLQVDEEE